MADLLIRDLDNGVKAALQAQASRNGRSMSAEIRAILSSAVRIEGARNAASVADAFFTPEIRMTPEEALLFDEVIDAIDGRFDAPDFA